MITILKLAAPNISDRLMLESISLNSCRWPWLAGWPISAQAHEEFVIRKDGGEITVSVRDRATSEANMCENGTSRFKVGDRVRYVGGGCLAARPGATATIAKTDPYLHVIWDRNELWCNQNDGGYSAHMFEKLEPVTYTTKPSWVVRRENIKGGTFGFTNTVATWEEAERLAGGYVRQGETCTIYEAVTIGSPPPATPIIWRPIPKTPINSGSWTGR